MSDILKLSVSKTKLFDDCKAKYRFAYELKLPRKDFHFHIFGKFLHKVLEDFHLEYINGSVEPHNKVMSKVYKTALTEYKSKIDEPSLKEAHLIVEAYLEKLSNEKFPEILSVEKDFNILISDTVLLNGMIDRIQKDPDGVIHVCDYKTTKNKKYIKNDFAQLLTYAYVIYNMYPSVEKVRGSYIMLRHDFEYITKEFSKEEILEVKDKYASYADSIKEEKLWAPTPTRLCQFCDFLDVCNEGKNLIKPKISHGVQNW